MWMGVQIGVVLASVGLAMGVPAGAVSSTNPDVRSKIIFHAEDGNLYHIRPDGTRLTRFTKAPKREFSAAWSPDRRKVVYSCRGAEILYEGADLCVKDVRSGDVRRLTNDKRADFDASWAPEGRWIAFSRYLGESSAKGEQPDIELFLIRPSGKELTQLTNGEAISRSPTWSPDGSMLAYESYDADEQARIWMLSIDSGEARPVTMGAMASDTDPAWSPDGDHIAFTRTTASTGPFGTPEIWVLEVDTLLTTKVGDLTGYGVDWSPTGKRLVYSSLVGHGTPSLFTARADGSGKRLIFKGSLGAYSPSW